MITIDDQIAVAEREVRMRERVYPGLVDRKKMTLQKAGAELAAMQEIVKTLRRVKEQEQLL